MFSQEREKRAGRVAALDVGDVWTGFAVSDETRSIARPVEVVGSSEVAAFLGAMVRDEGVTEVVVGMPKTLSGEVGYQARRVSAKLDELRDAFPELGFVEWDERFTTSISKEIVGNRDRLPKGKRRGGRRSGAGRVDHIAAARMLQEYLEARGEA
ncbi:Holliday junction resolvase RuvX [Rubrobacter indicoceani]|uniref:Holliday junction resolvase RuvX n=1 Tax=Rubrobacter indicoceani TaxID=2051957 RepID=UPI000E5B79ED|nr:Holliday junction resolvase RuvX [Rubrobacter indicoceani]